MPYISVITSRTLDKELKDSIKTELGRAITIIPGKSEEVLMIDFSDGHTIYYGGKEIENTAYIEVKMLKKSSTESLTAFTEEVFRIMDSLMGIDKDNLNVTLHELDMWGMWGSLRVVN